MYFLSNLVACLYIQGSLKNTAKNIFLVMKLFDYYILLYEVERIKFKKFLVGGKSCNILMGEIKRVLNMILQRLKTESHFVIQHINV